MATAIIPKSEFRKNDNIEIGYGEVPAIDVDGVAGWGLPGGIVTFSEREAREYAAKLHDEIILRMSNLNQLISA
jgi:hypothetical protein